MEAFIECARAISQIFFIVFVVFLLLLILIAVSCEDAFELICHVCEKSLALLFTFVVGLSRLLPSALLNLLLSTTNLSVSHWQLHLALIINMLHI